jgi:hypothetical protein
MHHRREQCRIEVVALSCLVDKRAESLHPGMRFVA